MKGIALSAIIDTFAVAQETYPNKARRFQKPSQISLRAIHPTSPCPPTNLSIHSHSLEPGHKDTIGKA